MAGGVAGSAGWFSICPLEVIKNRIQTGVTVSSTNIYQTAIRIYSTEGFNAFYRGGLTLIIRGFPVNAILFVVYAKSMAFIQGFHTTKELQSNNSKLLA